MAVQVTTCRGRGHIVSTPLQAALLVSVCLTLVVYICVFVPKQLSNIYLQQLPTVHYLHFHSRFSVQ